MTGRSADPASSASGSILDPPRPAVVEAVARALAEDLLPLGDLTASLLPEGTVSTVSVVSRSHGVVAGRACALETFAQVDPSVQVEWHLPDGTAVAPGDVVATATGSLRSILTTCRPGSCSQFAAPTSANWRRRSRISRPCVPPLHATRTFFFCWDLSI